MFRTAKSAKTAAFSANLEKGATASTGLSSRQAFDMN
jgi:hypothetical protein